MNESHSQPESAAEQPRAETEGEPPEPGYLESSGTEPSLPAASLPAANLQVPIANEQASLRIDEVQLEAAVRTVFRDSHYLTGLVSIAVVDDPTIHKINRQYLQHDYPTDVLSFVLEDDQPRLEGELIVSTDTAATNSADLSWSAHDELTLYVVHGALHLVGYLDKQPAEALEMRAAEAKILTELGIQLPAGDSRWSDSSCSDGSYSDGGASSL